MNFLDKQEELITFNINIHTNSLLVKGEIPADFKTFEILGKFIDAISKLNKELEIVILFDMDKVPFMFILYLNKIQNTLLQEGTEVQFTIISKDLELKNFLDGFKKNTDFMDSHGVNPFQDIMKTLGAGEIALDNIDIPESLKDKMSESTKKNIDSINDISLESLQSKMKDKKYTKTDEEMEDLNIEELNKIKFIYRP